MSIEHNMGDKRDHMRTIHRWVVKISQDVTTKAGKQHPEDTTPEANEDGQGHPVFRRRCQRGEAVA